MNVRRLARLPWLEIGIFVAAIAALASLGLGRAPAGAEFDTYSTYDAKSGGYRALYELARQQQLAVAPFELRPAFLDASYAALVYAEPLAFDPFRGAETNADARAIEAWVRAGGRLVYVGHDDEAAKEKLLDFPASRRASAARREPAIAASARRAGVTALGPVSTDLRWKLSRRGVATLYDDGRGAVAIAYPFGRGTVTAIIDQRMFDNANIAKADRARFAAELLATAAGGRTVWFDESVHGHLVPQHWWQIVPRPFVIATIVATIALAVAVFGAAVRFGPPIRPARVDDRTSADFIDALSTLLERGKASKKAAADATRSTSRAVARSLGLAGDPQGDEIAARIADQERRADFETMLALMSEPNPAPATFVRAVALAQRLRKDAVAHGR